MDIPIDLHKELPFPAPQHAFLNPKMPSWNFSSVDNEGTDDLSNWNIGAQIPSALGNLCRAVLARENLPLIFHSIIRERELDRDLTGRDIETPGNRAGCKGAVKLVRGLTGVVENLRVGPVVNTSARLSTAVRVLLNDVEVVERDLALSD